MKRYNCIMIFDGAMEHVLMCRRTKDPFLGKYNLVGGKEEPRETAEQAAYRELFEETGISRDQVRLTHLMGLDYFPFSQRIEIFTGILTRPVRLVEEINPLSWISVHEDFTDRSRFAGSGNIHHMVQVALHHREEIFPPQVLAEMGTADDRGDRGNEE